MKYLKVMVMVMVMAMAIEIALWKVTIIVVKRMTMVGLVLMFVVSIQ